MSNYRRFTLDFSQITPLSKDENEKRSLAQRMLHPQRLEDYSITLSTEELAADPEGKALLEQYNLIEKTI